MVSVPFSCWSQINGLLGAKDQFKAEKQVEMYSADIYKPISGAESDCIGSIGRRRTGPKRSSAGLVVGVGIRVWTITFEIRIIGDAYSITLALCLQFIDECSPEEGQVCGVLY